MSDRFVLVGQDNAFEVLKVDSEYLALVESMVVDTQAEHGPKTLGSDELEPEDARFTRRLSWVPEKLNELARELECERAEIRSLKADNEKQHAKIAELQTEVKKLKREFDLCPRY